MSALGRSVRKYLTEDGKIDYEWLEDVRKQYNKIQEGRMNKGGRNPKPSSQRPSSPPTGQSSKRKMKIYIASSWKNTRLACKVAIYLINKGHRVDAFFDNSSGRYVFDWREIEKDRNKLNAVSFLRNRKAQKAFKEDKKWLDWCDCVVLVLPAGNSSHLEAGYAKGKGKILIIYHPTRFPKGEFDVMYGFADLLTEKMNEIDDYLRGRKNEIS